MRWLVGEAPTTLTAGEQWHGGNGLTLAPVTGSRADGDDLAAELVAEHIAGRHGAVRLEVGSADAAGLHAQHELARAGRWIGDVGDVEVVLLVDDGGAHQ